jgi:AraC family transcriptional regulator, glycine betaine-responsive activator
MVASTDKRSALGVKSRTECSFRKPRQIGVLLIEGFSLTECALVLGTLHAANELLAERVYSYSVMTLSGEDVPSESGTSIRVDGQISPRARLDELVVIGGRWDIAHAGRAAAAQLRWFARRGVTISALSSAVGLLAFAGLLDGEPCAVSWQYQDAFREMFPALSLSKQLFNFGRRVATCVGGAATLDFMVDRFAIEHGRPIAIAVLDRFACDYPRPAETQHWATYRRLLKSAGPGFASVAEMMEQNISEPVTCEALAKAAHRSPRQIQRWFREHVGYGLRTFYRNMRLMKALNLLRYSSLSIGEIAVITGFCSHTNFTRNFRSHYGFHPRDVRLFRRSSLGLIPSQSAEVPTLADAVRAQLA